ncbi:MAG: peptidoglycan binding domain-containing protein [Eubacteriales bacterium]|nr:peptidoglycan binding domain-containing protein [Eubacteriales bacterium]
MNSREKKEREAFEEKLDEAMEKIVAEFPLKNEGETEEGSRQAGDEELYRQEIEHQGPECEWEDGDLEELDILEDEEGAYGEDESYEWDEDSGEEDEESYQEDEELLGEEGSCQEDEEDGEAPVVTCRKPSGKSRSAGQRKSARPRQIAYVPLTEEDLSSKMVRPPKRKKHKGIKVFGLVSSMMAVAVLCSYGAVSYYYADRFFQGTRINGIDCSGLTAYQAEQAIAQKVEDYSIQVLARDQQPQTIRGDQINYQYASNGEVLSLLKSQKPYEWVRGFLETREYTTAENATYDKTLLQTEVKALECAKEENQVEPENAYVALNGSQFEIVPETEGTKLKLKEAYKALDAAISGSQQTVDFDTSSGVYVQAAVTSNDQELQATRDAYNNYTKASITYNFGENSVTLDGGTLKDWLEFDEKGQLINDEASFQEHIKSFVAQLASDHDTVGTQREFHTTNGRTVYVYGSAYGWKIDQSAEAEQLTKDIRSGAQTSREPIYSMTANSHGYNDLGNTYIEVDLGVQHMYYYRNGSLIFDSDFVSGDMRYEDRRTPEGIYTLYFKKSPEVLKGRLLPDGTYEYEAPVSYWMPFNGGVGFHDAPWQPYFGGDRYLSGGSHGCINLPPSSAAYLYELIDYSVPIVCFY